MSIYSRLKTMLQVSFSGINIEAGPCAKITSGELLRPEGVRTYLRALPTQAAPAEPAAPGKRPLVIILHGAGANAKQVLGLGFPPSPLSVWLEIAEREHWVVLAPDGNQSLRQRCWNDGYADIASNPKTDDVGFISALIDQTIAEDAVDPARVYVIGVSKGGMMAYRLANELGTRLAAFAALLASMPVNSHCAMPQHPVSALIIANTADPLVRYHGGRAWFTFSMHAPARAIEDSVAVWRKLAALPAEPLITHFRQQPQGNSGLATRYVWGDDSTRLQVSLIRIEQGGHTEPSARKRYPRLLTWLVGAQNADFEVAEEAWAFFKDKRGGLGA